MIDREKVIGLLQETAEYFRECRSNASLVSRAENHFWELQNAANEAVELIKAQEPTSPTWSQGKACCGKCSQRLPRKSADRETNYCSYCGQAVKWE